ncbi:MAG: hypothetical protein WKF30_15410 [Pyrinomonadaceae bacterium]
MAQRYHRVGAGHGRHNRFRASFRRSPAPPRINTSQAAEEVSTAAAHRLVIAPIVNVHPGAEALASPAPG